MQRVGISIEQSTACSAASQPACNISKHQTPCLRQQTTVEPQPSGNQDNFASASDGIDIRCSPGNQTISPVHLTVRDQMQPLRHHSEWRCISNGLPLLQLHREWRCSQLTATDFRNRQPSACIWSFHDRVQQPGNQTTSPVHLIVRDRVQSLRRFIANDVWSTGFRNRQLPACIWPFHGRMQQPDNQTTPPVHLTSSRSGAGTRASTASHLIAMGLGATQRSDTFNRQCIWWHRHQMQPWQLNNRQCIWLHRGQMQSFWHHIFDAQPTSSSPRHIQPPVHLMASASDAALAISTDNFASASDRIAVRCSILASHSFDHFLTSSGDRWSAPIHTHFIKFPYKKTSVISISDQDHLHTVAHATAKGHFNVSANGHFERSFHARQTGQISHHFLRFIVGLSALQLSLPSFFKSSDQGTAEWPLMCPR